MSPLVTLPDGRQFFVDHACTSLMDEGDDVAVAQLLCDLAFWAGHSMGGGLFSFAESRAMIHDTAARDSLEREIDRLEWARE